ncbi:hypothetical protein GTP44_25325 [Duganella sp. FT50W]|uniref:Integrase n=1 Tax=Duganella lactea TaxID=2692173 RepID=A0A6L8MT70_9BURK|nr:hypothetical protein [Duganella lactea]MYM85247.1 hypothetical protein [Duganella lactea]
MPPNLRKSPYGYTYLRSIPAELRPLIPGKKTVVKEALGRDRSKALARWAELEVYTTKLFADARNILLTGRRQESALDAFLKKDRATRLKELPASTDGLAEQLSALYLSGLDNDYSARENQSRWFDDDEPAELTSQIDEVLAMLRKAVLTGNTTAFQPMVDQLAMMRGYQLIDESGEDLQRVTFRFLRAALAGCETLAKRQQGQFADTPALPAEPLPASWELDALATPKPPPAPVPVLSDVTEHYIKFLETKHSKTQTTSLSCWQRFVTFCNDKPLSQIGTNDVYSFFEARLHAEKKPWSMDYCSTVHRGLGEAFTVAKTKELCKHNPAKELEMLPKIKASEERKRLKPRYPYTVEQLNILFSSDWYDPVATNWLGRMKWDLGARYWVPLLCLFHGLRIREVLQLLAADVKVEEVPLLSIQVDEGGADEDKRDDDNDDRLPTRTLKNDATKRTVPPSRCRSLLGWWRVRSCR